MILESILIKRFRSIENAKINLTEICAIIGENNNGKSAILRALNSFFNIDIEKPNFDDGSHRYSSRTRFSEIELSFSDIPHEDHYTNKITNSDKLIIRFRYNYGTKKYVYHYYSDRYYELSLDFINNLISDISFVLIPPNRDEVDLIWSKKSLLREVLIEHLKNQTGGRDMLTPFAQKATKEIERLAFSKVERSVNEYYSINKNFKIQISYSKDNDYSLLLDGIVLSVDENNTTFKITECGSGVQSITVISLYTYLAKLRHKKIILGIEEPETNLHPQAQRELIKSLKRDASDVQTLFTTHSTTIIDQLDHEEVLLIRKVPDNVRNFKTVTTQILPDFWAKYNLQEFNYYQFHKYKNSEFFFAKLVVITESKNEVEVIKRLLHQMNIDLELKGVEFIELDGVDKLKYAYSILRELKIPFLVVLDKDFFIPYLNDELELSRSPQGFPRYRFEFKNNDLINTMIPFRTDRDNLLNQFTNNRHKSALAILKKHNIVCMNYCLEIDLVCSGTGERIYYDMLGLRGNDRNKHNLLVGNRKAIKKIKNIVNVLDRLAPRNLPYSYKQIKNLLFMKMKEI